MKKFLPVLVVLFSMATSAQAASSIETPNSSVVLSPADAYVMMEEMVSPIVSTKDAEKPSTNIVGKGNSSNEADADASQQAEDWAKANCGGAANFTVKAYKADKTGPPYACFVSIECK